MPRHGAGLGSGGGSGSATGLMHVVGWGWIRVEMVWKGVVRDMEVVDECLDGGFGLIGRICDGLRMVRCASAKW